MLSLCNLCSAAEAAACDGDGALGKQMTISGACERRSDLNGAYTLQGTTADGREYYVNGAGYYLFYDANCGGDAETFLARWKIAPVKPSTTATTDLAGDGGTCLVYAILNTAARTLPSSATWRMVCTADSAVDTVLSIAPPTCICKLGYSGDSCEVGSAPPACDGKGASGKQMTISGACEGNSFVNGAYTLQGTTADGREYYTNGAGYLFYDANCGGDAKTSPAEWKIAPAKPSTTATTDLAGDGGTCASNAYLNTAARTLPSSATWNLACAADTSFVDAVLSIAAPTCICKLGYSGENCEVGSAPPACDGDGASGKQMTISGACEGRSSLNGAYTLQGTTADGREYYANGVGQYLFYDANCAGDAETYSARWKITDVKPSTTATTDLAGDGGTCAQNAFLNTAARTLPSSATWLMFCAAADTFVDTVLAIAAPTCICKLGYSGDNCEIGSAPPACDGEGTAGKQLVVSGACERQSSLNGVYALQGKIADGTEYFMNGEGDSLYYETDCTGTPAKWVFGDAARWVFDNTKATTNLANVERGCVSSGYLPSAYTTPPAEAKWRMACELDASFTPVNTATCKCNGKVNTDNQGAPDCSSFSSRYQRPFCYTDVGACSDGRISGSVENAEYSNDVCGGEEYSDVAITIDPPTCVCKPGYSGDNCESGTTTKSTTTTTTTTTTSTTTTSTTTTTTTTTTATMSFSTTTAATGVNSTTATPTTNVTTMPDASTTLAAKIAAPGQTTTTKPTPSV
eukprot:gene3690-biopygen9005